MGRPPLFLKKIGLFRKKRRFSVKKVLTKAEKRSIIKLSSGETEAGKDETKMTTIKNIREMTTATIENEKFYIVSFDLAGLTDEERNQFGYTDRMYGTIPFELIDRESGKIKKVLCLADLWYGKDIANAIQRRKDAFEAQRTIEKLRAMGLNI